MYWAGCLKWCLRDFLLKTVSSCGSEWWYYHRESEPKRQAVGRSSTVTPFHITHSHQTKSRLVHRQNVQTWASSIQTSERSNDKNNKHKKILSFEIIITVPTWQKIVCQSMISLLILRSWKTICVGRLNLQLFFCAKVWSLFQATQGFSHPNYSNQVNNCQSYCPLSAKFPPFFLSFHCNWAEKHCPLRKYFTKKTNCGNTLYLT